LAVTKLTERAQQESGNTTGALLYETESPRTRTEEKTEERKENIIVRETFD
jgi:hypothetical protein